MAFWSTGSRAGKLAGAVSLLLHLWVVGVVPFADASLDAVVADRQVHMEAEGKGPCAPLHDHLTCQLCRVLGRDATLAASAAPDLASRTAQDCRIPVGSSTVPRGTFRFSRSPRAPPVFA